MITKSKIYSIFSKLTDLLSSIIIY